MDTNNNKIQCYFMAKKILYICNIIWVSHIMWEVDDDDDDGGGYYYAIYKIHLHFSGGNFASILVASPRKHGASYN